MEEISYNIYWEAAKWLAKTAVGEAIKKLIDKYL